MTEALGAGAAAQDELRQGRRPGPRAGSATRTGRGTGARRAYLLGYLLSALSMLSLGLLIDAFARRRMAGADGGTPAELQSTR